jgi:hypothetical protein
LDRRPMRYPLADVLRDLSQWFNYAEVAIWPAMGLVLLVAGFRRTGVVRRDYWLAAGVLFAFGPTDYFEAANGNEWWRPWWLLLWKAACVTALLAIVVTAWRRERRGRTARADDRPTVAPQIACPLQGPEGAEAP